MGSFVATTSNTSQPGTTHATRKKTDGSRRAFQAETMASGSSAEAETERSEAAGLRQELNLPLSVLPQEIPSEVLQTAGGA